MPKNKEVEKTFTETQVNELIEKKAIEKASKIVEDSNLISKAVEIQGKVGKIHPTIDLYKGREKVTILNDEKNLSIWSLKGYRPL